ncbi:MAG: phosphoribosylglycinamide formyltransferase [Nitrospinota bacterium]|nr:phosphoribosylglycinamide formyltransferase [Nitrospinota bacterium]
MRIAVFASGRGSNLRALMEAAGTGYLKAEIAVVLSDVQSAQALERASQQGLSARFLEPEAFEDAALEILRNPAVDLVCLAGFMRILSGDFIQQCGVPILNVHPSLLPAFPGLRAQRQALKYGARVSGATVHLVDEQVDHGPVIAQAPVPVFEDDDEESLSQRILRQEHRIYPMAVKYIAEGRLRIVAERVIIDGALSDGAALCNPSE